MGFEVDLLSMNEGLYFINEKLIKNEGAHIVTINPEMIETAAQNEDLAYALDNAELVIPDGVGITLALRLKGIKQRRVAGIVFAHKLIAMSADKGYSTAFVGAHEEVVNRAVENLKKEFPPLEVAYKRNGYFSEDEENEVIEKIIESNARIVFVALGIPRQEIFIRKLKEKRNDLILIGVGGSFDVWSGFVERAPVIWQKLGLEWLYRTIKQPERFKRIFPTLPLFLFRVIIENVQQARFVD